MSASRRGFLFGGAAVATLIATPALVRATSLMPVSVSPMLLYGDGEHDDSRALQAAIDGKRVWSVAERRWHMAMNNGFFTLPHHSVHRIDCTLMIVDHKMKVFDFSGAVLECGPTLRADGGPALRMVNTEDVWLQSITVIGFGGEPPTRPNSDELLRLETLGCFDGGWHECWHERH